jgi:ribonuclease HI
MGKVVHLYTDGACRGNPGPGGCAALLMYGTHKKEMACGYAATTNNRMELQAVILGLKILKEPCEVVIFSDSKYVVDSVQKGWLKGWKLKGWKTSQKKPVANRDLWECIDTLMIQHRCQFEWVKGHATNPFNNRCDELAVEAAARDSLQIDEGFIIAEEA